MIKRNIAIKLIQLSLIIGADQFAMLCPYTATSFIKVSNKIEQLITEINLMMDSKLRNFFSFMFAIL